jgi:hypothetical protein
MLFASSSSINLAHPITPNPNYSLLLSLAAAINNTTTTTTARPPAYLTLFSKNSQNLRQTSCYHQSDAFFASPIKPNPKNKKQSTPIFFFFFLFSYSFSLLSPSCTGTVAHSLVINKQKHQKAKMMYQ